MMNGFFNVWLDPTGDRTIDILHSERMLCQYTTESARGRSTHISKINNTNYVESRKKRNVSKRQVMR